MHDDSPRYLLPLLLLGLLVMGAAACDSSGGNSDDDMDNEEPSTAGLWEAAQDPYEGSGREIDFQGAFSVSEDTIQPRLAIDFNADTTLNVVQLEWDNGNAVIPHGGPLETLTEDSLITATDTATIQDSVQTWFRFRLGRSGGGTGRVEAISGTLRQYYEEAFPVDSTIVVFEVSRN